MEVNEQMILKAALIETTATQGWLFLEKFMETIVREIEQSSVSEEDDQKANGLRRDARGARKFKDKLLERIQLAKNCESNNNFIEVATD